MQNNTLRQGVEVGRFLLPEINKIFVTYMFDPDEIGAYDNKTEDVPSVCDNCGEHETIILIEGNQICQNCGKVY